MENFNCLRFLTRYNIAQSQIHKDYPFRTSGFQVEQFTVSSTTIHASINFPRKTLVCFDTQTQISTRLFLQFESLIPNEVHPYFT